MTQESDNIEVEAIGSETPIQAETIEHTPIELEAMKQGWKPKTDYIGDDKDFVGAEAYIARGPLIKENKELRKAFEKLAMDTAKMEKVVYERAKKDLQVEADKAWASGDREAYLKAQTEIKELQPVTKQQDDPLKDPEVQKYLSDNPWIMTPRNEEEIEMRALAIATSDYHKEKNPNAPYSENLAYVESKLRTRFPHRYKNMEREAPSAVAAVRPKANPASTNNSGPHPDYHKLTDTQKMIGDRITNSKYSKITWDQYIQQLKQDGRLS